MALDLEKTPAECIAEGRRYLETVAHPKGPGRFGAELLYQTVLLGLEFLLHGRLVEAGAPPESHNASGLALEYQELVECNAAFARELVEFTGHQNVHGDRPSRERVFPLSVEEVRATARRILEILG